MKEVKFTVTMEISTAFVSKETEEAAYACFREDIETATMIKTAVLNSYTIQQTKLIKNEQVK